MQSQNTGDSLRDAARQASVATGGPGRRWPPRGTDSAPPAAKHRCRLRQPRLSPARHGRPTVAATRRGGCAPYPAGSSGGHQGTIQILSGPSAGKELPLSKP